MTRRIASFWVVLALATGCREQDAPPGGRVAAGGGEPSLRHVGTIPLDGVEGRIDHMALDAKRDRLFVAALGNDTVEVIDLKAGKRLERIRGIKKPQGVAYLADADRLLVASGDDGKCRVYDADLKLLGAVDGLDDADNVRYDAAAKLAYVGYGDGALAVIDPLKVVKVGEVKLEGHPESFQLEAGGTRVFVNVPTAKQIAVIDREKREVVAKWPVVGAEANFPMALDEEHRRLFVGCRKPARLLVYDTATGKPVATVDCCGDTDDVFYDATRRTVYASGGEGCVSVLRQTDPNTYANAGKVKTAAGARTSFFVPASGRLYVAVPHRGGQSCAIQVYAGSE